MELWMWLTIFVLVVYFIVYRHLRESSRFPPGFPRYPIVGSLLSLPWNKTGSEIVIQSTAFAHKYGKLMGYFVGPVQRSVIVQDFDLAKEMAHSDVFSGRVNHPKFIELRGIDNRPADLGFGKKSLGNVITEEATAVAEKFKRKSGKDVLIENNFNIPIFNILWCIVAAKRFQPDDPQIGGYMKHISTVYKYLYIDILLPWLRYIYPGIYRRSKHHFDSLRMLFMTAIEEHKNTFSSEEKPKNFIEAYLREMKENTDLTVNDLVGLCIDFFEAGGETVGATLSWIMMYLANYPDVQEKCYLELQSVVGGAPPNLDDQPRLPYCVATIMEIQRLCSAATVDIGHVALQDATLGEYNIPKDTHIFYNIWKFHHDPDYFPEPWTFKPERFHSPDGSSIVRHEHFIPFGFGKRVCMGESLAKAELFLFFTVLVQMLKVSKPKEHMAPSEDDYESIFIRTPNPFYVHVVAR